MTNPLASRLARFFAVVALMALMVPYSALAARQQDDVSQWSGAATYSGDVAPSFSGMPANTEVLRLENGLQVLLMHNPSQDMVSIVTQVKVGSAFEDFRTSGMSHMLEHLLFNGSERWTQEEQYDLADQIGAWNNAHTSDFFTNYIMLVPATAVSDGVELQAEMLFHSNIPSEKFEKERGIVIGEIVQGRDRGGNEADDAVRDAMLNGSSLALPTLGTLSTIRNMDRDDVWTFYKNHYVPNNMITTVAGNFDREAVLTLLREHYGSVAPGTVNRPTLTPAPYIDRTKVVSRRAGETEVLAMAFEAPSFGSPDYFPFLVLTSLLNTSATGILTRAIDELPANERPSVGVWWEMASGFGRLVIEMELPAGGDPARYHDLVLDALKRASDQGITNVDVDEVVRMRETETLIEREQLRHLAIMSAQPIAQGGVDFFLNFLPRLGAVKAENVGRVLAAYLVDSPHLLVHVQPREDVKQQDESSVDGVTLERSELSNGIVLVTLENPGSPLFAAHLTARNRAEIDADHPGVVNLAHRLLLKGIGGCDEECMARKLRGLGAEVKLVDNPYFPMDNYYTTGRFSWVRLETSTAKGIESLVLLLDLVQHAGFTEDDFVTEQQSQLESLGRGSRSARSRADNLLASGLYGDHPLVNSPGGTVESVGSATYDDVRRAFRRAFSPDNMIIAVVSSLPHDQLVSLLEEQIPGNGTPGPGMDPATAVTEDVRLTSSEGGEMAAIRLGSIFPVESGDAAALSLMTSVLSDRLAQDLRETRGLSYSVGAGVSVHNDVAEFEAWLNPPAPRLAEGEAALVEAVRSFDPASITQEELDTIRNARRGRLMMRRLSSIAQAYYLAMSELDGNVGRYLTPFASSDAVTLDDLSRVGRKYFAERAFVTVVAD